ncbi:MAG: cold shock domain-containing protein [bacterium]
MTPDDGTKDVFVHMSGLANGVSIVENDRVQYETQESEKGLNAINVEKI